MEADRLSEREKIGVGGKLVRCLRYLWVGGGGGGCLWLVCEVGEEKAGIDSITVYRSIYLGSKHL